MLLILLQSVPNSKEAQIAYDTALVAASFETKVNLVIFNGTKDEITTENKQRLKAMNIDTYSAKDLQINLLLEQAKATLTF